MVSIYLNESLHKRAAIGLRVALAQSVNQLDGNRSSDICFSDQPRLSQINGPFIPDQIPNTSLQDAGKKDQISLAANLYTCRAHADTLLPVSLFLDTAREEEYSDREEGTSIAWRLV